MELYLSYEDRCSYLPEKERQDVFTNDAQLTGGHLEALSQIGFRRSGVTIYRPNCKSCRACEPTRLLVNNFKPSKSQRRNLRKNSDITFRWADFEVGEEHHEVYSRYQDHQHNGAMSGDIEEVKAYFSHPTIEVKNIEYTLNGKLIGVSVVDVMPNALSSVYFYFDPDFKKRGLGTYSSLIEIQETQRLGLDFWYLGYTIKGCTAMEYKENFRPQQRFLNDCWVQIA